MTQQALAAIAFQGTLLQLDRIALSHDPRRFKTMQTTGSTPANRDIGC
jgi:hypothetical protein